MNSVSVIVTTYNRGTDLGRCLDTLLAQETDGMFTFDVIVADNNSTDDTRKVVQGYEDRFPGRVRTISEPKPGKSHALNAAAAQAGGDILAFTDDDTKADPRWLVSLVRCFNEHQCDGVGGRVLPFYPEGTPRWIKENIDQLGGPIVCYDHGIETRLYQKPTFEFLGCNFAFRREVFDACGYFVTDIGPGYGIVGEDTEFVNRVLNAGKRLFYCGAALIRHPVERKRMNLVYIARWNIALGRYRVIIGQDGKIDPHLVYWFGIPRYLVRLMLRDAMGAGLAVFNMKEFLKHWKELFRNWGRAMQIRKIYTESKR